MSKAIEVLTAAYRALANEDAFDDLMAAIADADGLTTGLSESQIVVALQAIVASIDQVPESERRGLTDLVLDRSQVAFVLDPDARVLAINAAAKDMFGLEPGRIDELNWAADQDIERIKSAFAAARKGLADHFLTRLYGADEGSILAEISTAPAPEHAHFNLVVSQVGPAWSAAIAERLAAEFSLTKAEVSLCGLFAEGFGFQQIARKRQSSVRTVRTQFSTIFEKVGVHSQAALLRLLAGLTNRASSHKGVARWRDPLGQERYISTGDRQLAYSTMGQPGGRAMVLIHGPMTGYVMRQEIREVVKAAGIEIFALCRPGFGNSDPGHGANAVEDGVEALSALITHLGLGKVPLISLTNGLIPALHFAERRPQNVSSITALGACLPLETSEQRADLPDMHRWFLEIVLRDDVVAELVMRTGYRAVAARGAEFMVKRLYSNSRRDLETVFDPQLIGTVLASASMTVAQGHRAIMRDLQLISHPFEDQLKNASHRIHMLAGLDDPVFPAARVESYLNKVPQLSADFLDAGQTVFHSCPEAVLGSIIDADAS